MISYDYDETNCIPSSSYQTMIPQRVDANIVNETHNGKALLLSSSVRASTYLCVLG